MSDHVNSDLRKYYEKQEEEIKDREAMIEEITDAIGVELQDLFDKHEQIVKKYGFEQKFSDTVKELL